MHRNPDTITGLLEVAPHPRADVQSFTNLVEIRSFGSNPGNLRAYVHIPANLRPNASLVVVLHGCTQSAADYNAASGWSKLAEDLGFVVLLPEQRRSNNFGLCFNWFELGDTAQDAGEVQSIRQMIAAVQSSQPIDSERIFITGFSGGGAMTSAMLATYPKVFAGGAIIAGMPYGVASGMMDAFAKMQGHRLPDAGALAEMVVQASDNAGPWPTIAIWHGSADHTVNVANADAIARQWRVLHKLDDQPSRIETVDGVPHRSWCDGQGRTLVEDYIVPAMGHGTPLQLSGPAPYGTAAPYMLDVGISAPVRIAQSWGLMRAAASDTAPAPDGVASSTPSQHSDVPTRRPPIARVLSAALRAVRIKA